MTEASLALNARWGRVESPFWAFAPEENMYVQETQPAPPPLGRDAPAEVFAFAGARTKLRAYNAYLQGQFRQSDLTYGEGLRSGVGSRSIVWGSIEVSKSFQ